MVEFAVIFPAAGLSTRFGGGRSKLLERVGGKSVLERSLRAFAGRPDVKSIVVATGGASREGVPDIEGMVVCEGGTCRAGSVFNALRRVPEEIDWVAVHDAARPLVSAGLIDRVLSAAVEHGAAAPGVGVVQTIRRVVGGVPGVSGGTVAREGLFAMQTPQIARRGELLRAFEKCPIPLEQVTDDVQVLELSGVAVWIVAGEESNLKITMPMDLMVAEGLWGKASRGGMSAEGGVLSGEG